eukprot:1904463-Pyramimonas_sp.AAC.1
MVSKTFARKLLSHDYEVDIDDDLLGVSVRVLLNFFSDDDFFGTRVIGEIDDINVRPPFFIPCTLVNVLYTLIRGPESVTKPYALGRLRLIDQTAPSPALGATRG